MSKKYPDHTLRTSEVAELMGCSIHAVRNWGVPSVKITTGKVRYSAAEIDRFCRETLLKIKRGEKVVEGTRKAAVFFLTGGILQDCALKPDPLALRNSLARRAFRRRALRGERVADLGEQGNHVAARLGFQSLHTFPAATVLLGRLPLASVLLA